MIHLPQPVPVCPGGYARLADLAGNQRAAFVALARLADLVDMQRGGALLMILLDALRHWEELHAALVECPTECTRCHPPREYLARKEGNPCAP